MTKFARLGLVGVLFSLLAFTLALQSETTLLVFAGGGNAEVYRHCNLQFFEMTLPQHPPGNSSVMRCRNLQFFEMTPQPHPPGDAFVTRKGNLQYFEMSPATHPPDNAYVSRSKNLQFFEMTPIRPFSSTITSFTTADQQGNNKSSFMPGDTVFLRVAVSGSGQQSISNTLVSVMIQDANLTPVFIDYEYCDIQIGGQVTIYFNFQLSSDCTLGDYVAKVNIFTMLPSEGGEPIVGGHAEVYFAVT